jgi:hypothetical protein
MQCPNCRGVNTAARKNLWQWRQLETASGLQEVQDTAVRMLHPPWHKYMPEVSLPRDDLRVTSPTD